ncbi:homoserine kinase [Synechococcus sp. PCC 7502]|uniref:homoserine kinase n=1 Tax=Synechococcus sp. PCC 7502 TaxID=1173263 RepID=UPI00029FDF9F|nr:homoserine kinase [Synechococcus sp. PCC 7502]AFY73982.1 homoserine kinase [Synechococcus sp. PCC 7502]
MTSFVVAVPATTGNLGAGFDCLGAALSLYNRFEFALASELEIKASGVYGKSVARDESNLIYTSLVKFFKYIDRPIPALSLNIEANIPMARGLGSSATAIVGGIVGGNLLAGSPCTQRQLLDLAIAIEGHPDNVAAAMLGGCQLSATRLDGSWEICAIAWHPEVAIAVAIPNFELSTSEARAVLPQTVPMADAIFNASHLAFLTQALTKGNPQWLQTALQDRLHQPYRESLIVGLKEVEKAAIAFGAYGMVVSGAGPTLLAIGHPRNIEGIANGMVKAWQSVNIVATKKVLSIATSGTTCTVN